ncbi:hypothetical protein EVAR_36363_1 [Eumeta japonica]|uniref:Uncharacterized protein n=1 Tax=Eumeta variegata TaxID=151549 RepID=A0A4C1W5T9_EUMVA|nr:hypothetical protein EVAR_36363_1 [Eumeta japonica]
MLGCRLIPDLCPSELNSSCELLLSCVIGHSAFKSYLRTGRSMLSALRDSCWEARLDLHATHTTRSSAALRPACNKRY